MVDFYKLPTYLAENTYQRGIIVGTVVLLFDFFGLYQTNNIFILSRKALESKPVKLETCRTVRLLPP